MTYQVLYEEEEEEEEKEEEKEEEGDGAHRVWLLLQNHKIRLPQSDILQCI